jgi:hypothetical protein
MLGDRGKPDVQNPIIIFGVYVDRRPSLRDGEPAFTPEYVGRGQVQPFHRLAGAAFA